MLLSKLTTLLSTTKGAAAATVVAAAALTSGVAATNQDVQNAVNTAVDATVQTITRSSDSSQPAVVAARNKADKNLRSAFQADQQTLAKLHSTHVDNTDRAKLTDTVNKADAALRARLTLALDDVAKLTLGREGHEGASGSTGGAGWHGGDRAARDK